MILNIKYCTELFFYIYHLGPFHTGAGGAVAV